MELKTYALMKGDSDGNLTREDLLVVPAQRETARSRMSFLNPDRKKALATARCLIEVEYNELRNAQYTTTYSDPKVQEWKDKESRTYKTALSRLNSLSERTLNLINAHFDSNNSYAVSLMVVLNSAPNESVLREIVVFSEFIKGDLWKEYLALLLNNLRSSHPMFAREDLSELDDAEMKAAFAVLTVASYLSKSEISRAKSYMESNMQMKLHDVIAEMDRAEMIESMTTELAAVIVDYPDRTGDIIDYFSSRRIALADHHDSSSLREHLTTSSQPLRDGLL